MLAAKSNDVTPPTASNRTNREFKASKAVTGTLWSEKWMRANYFDMAGEAFLHNLCGKRFHRPYVNDDCALTEVRCHCGHNFL